MLNRISILVARLKYRRTLWGEDGKPTLFGRHHVAVDHLERLIFGAPYSVARANG